MPVMPSAHSGVYCSTRSLSSWKAGLTTCARNAFRTRPSGADRPRRNANLPPHWRLRSHHSLLSGSIQDSSTALSDRRNRPNSSLSEFASFTRSGEFVYCSRNSRSYKPSCDDFVDDGKQQRAVGTGLDRDPFVGDRGVAAAHRVDGDELAAVALELRQVRSSSGWNDGLRRCRASRTDVSVRDRDRRIPRRIRRWYRSGRRPC